MNGEQNRQSSPAKTTNDTKAPKDPLADAMTSSALAEPPLKTANEPTPEQAADSSSQHDEPAESVESIEPVASEGGFFHGDTKAAEPAHDDPQSPSQAQPQETAEPLEWLASGVHAGNRSKAWYAGLIVGGVLIAALGFLITKDLFSTIVIALCAPIFGYLSIKKPQALPYRLDGVGITIGRKRFLYGQFRAFTVIDERTYTTIGLIPLTRFSPLIIVSYDPDMQQKIVDRLAAYLPLQEHKPDALDHLTSRIRF